MVFLYLDRMKKISLVLILITLIVFATSCGSSKETVDIPDITAAEKEAFAQVEGDTIDIANAETDYQIIIIEPGFNTWLSSIARPEGYYEQSYMENRNQLFVQEWNNRVLRPSNFDSNMYTLQIDYRHSIDYGYEVNYKLYNYFIYFQRKYGQKLGPFIPRI